MECCGLSSTGLNDIDANNITSDNISVISFSSVINSFKFDKLVPCVTNVF